MHVSGAIVRIDAHDLGVLRQVVDSPASIELEFNPEDPGTYELEKSFAAMHFLLTGQALGGEGPLSFLTNEALGWAVPFAPSGKRARVLEATLVARVADAIEAISAPALVARLDSPELRALEPFVGAELADEHKEWLLAVIQGLMTFMRQTADAGGAVLVFGV